MIDVPLELSLPLDVTGVDCSSMAKPEERLATLEERADWHRNIGWGSVAVFSALFSSLLTWYIPKEMSSLRESVKADGAAQLEPINEKLVKLTVMVELKQSKDVAQVLKNNADFAKNPKLAIRAVSTVAEQAKAEGIKTDPDVLKQANGELKQVSVNNPDLVRVAWAARLQLVSYRTFLNVGTEKLPPRAEAVFKFPGVLFDGGEIKGATQKLDGAYWRNFTFTNAIIEYDGGPMALENVVFINCTFRMNPAPTTDKLANTLMAQNRVTELFQ